MGSLRILIAEDDKLSATLLKALLEADGHEVCAVAASGASAIEAAQRLTPDAVLMDIYLNDEMSGVDAARIIVQDFAIPTLFITGSTDRVLLEQVVESGALGLIKKPISADELRVNLRILLYHQRMARRLGEQVARYRGFFCDAPVGMFVCDAGGILLECNVALARMLGYDSVLQLQQELKDVQGLYELAEHRSKPARRVKDGNQACIGRTAILRRRDGSGLEVVEYFSVETGAALGGERYHSVLLPVSPAGEASPCTVSQLDVLRGTIDAIPDLVLIMGLDRSILAANKAFFSHVGDPTSQTIDYSLFPFANIDAPCSGVCPYSQFLVDHNDHSGWVQLMSGGPEYYNTVSPLRSEDGTLFGCVQIFRLTPPIK